MITFEIGETTTTTGAASRTQRATTGASSILPAPVPTAPRRRSRGWTVNAPSAAPRGASGHAGKSMTLPKKAARRDGVAVPQTDFLAAA